MLFTNAVVLLALASGVMAQEAQQPDYSQSCTSAGCHDEYAKRNYVHGPVAAGACEACHRPQGAQPEHRFTLMAKGGELCAFCHLESHPGKVQHEPVAEGQCTACHDPHGGPTRDLLYASSVAELCLKCHEDVAGGKAFVHGPVAAGGCQACHDSHASDYPAMLFASKKDVCTHCHAEMQARIAECNYVHQPAQEDCLGCHDPHGGSNRMLTIMDAPALCYSCHQEIAEVIQAAKVKHEPVTQGKACSNCHDAHASNLEPLLRADPMDLCLDCHNKEMDSPTGRLEDMRRLLEENPQQHGPIKQRNCSACHQVHGNDRFRLLIDAYPPEFYAPYDEARYALCFDCHQADIVRTEYTDKLTDFRNGDRNLHFLHVHRKEKGRTCRACHETHASRQPKHIAAAVPFGNWEIPIVFRLTATGGSCETGCHKPYAYDRVSPVQNLVPGEQQTDAQPQGG
jgi:predicted CXXCH cytochrome family protein